MFFIIFNEKKPGEEYIHQELAEIIDYLCNTKMV
jgi:hypothetical protein